MPTEPLAGTRMKKVTQPHTPGDFAQFFNNIAKRYRSAKTITLVMDNLNAHCPGALYEVFKPSVAKSQISVMAGQCLNRRIDSMDELRSEVNARQAQRDRINATVDWQFTSEDARAHSIETALSNT